jgi:hypothetical protein
LDPQDDLAKEHKDAGEGYEVKEVLFFISHLFLYKQTQEKQIYAVIGQLEFEEAIYQDSTVIVRRTEED